MKSCHNFHCHRKFRLSYHVIAVLYSPLRTVLLRTLKTRLLLNSIVHHRSQYPIHPQDKRTILALANKPILFQDKWAILALPNYPIVPQDEWTNLARRNYPILPQNERANLARPDY
jgi:hypothetical protein